MIETIAFDADDTLWHNESLFSLSQAKFSDMLAPYHDKAWIDRRLYETEVRNLAHFGYGVKGFTLSMVETAIELSDGRIGGAEIQQLIELGKGMLDAPVALLPHVAETMAVLSAAGYRLMVITKGDLFDQESKIARSGLADHFAHVEIVSEKDEACYRRLITKHGLDPATFLMVGNSMKSDVLPVLALGAYAAHVPYHTTWEHERVSERPACGDRFAELAHLGLVPEVAAGLCRPSASSRLPAS